MDKEKLFNILKKKWNQEWLEEDDVLDIGKTMDLINVMLDEREGKL